MKALFCILVIATSVSCGTTIRKPQSENIETTCSPGSGRYQIGDQITVKQNSVVENNSTNVSSINIFENKDGRCALSTSLPAASKIYLDRGTKLSVINHSVSVRIPHIYYSSELISVSGHTYFLTCKANNILIPMMDRNLRDVHENDWYLSEYIQNDRINCHSIRVLPAKQEQIETTTDGAPVEI